MRKFKFKDYDSQTVDLALRRIVEDLASSAEKARQTHEQLTRTESIRLLTDLLEDEVDADSSGPSPVSQRTVFH